MSDTVEFRIWSGIKSRCFNPNEPGYKRYGARGIGMHEAWVRSFEAFFEALGPRPGPFYSVERLKNDRGYEPGNVVWALPTRQARNRRSNRLLTLDGITRPLSAWAELRGIKPSTVGMRLKRGWTVERALGILVPCVAHDAAVLDSMPHRITITGNGQWSSAKVS